MLQNITTTNNKSQLYFLSLEGGHQILGIISASYEIGIIKHLGLN